MIGKGGPAMCRGGVSTRDAIARPHGRHRRRKTLSTALRFLHRPPFHRRKSFNAVALRLLCRQRMADPLELRSLKMFVLIARHGSMRKAAADLDCTPSALSHGLRSLEEALGFSLFERTRSGLILTPPGQALLGKAQEIILSLEEIVSEFRGGTRWGEAQLRIGVTDTACRYLVPAVIREFRESFPETSLKVEVASPDALVEGVCQGKLDVGIAPLGRDYPDLETTELGMDELVFVVHPLHAWTRLERIGVEDIQREKLILPKPGSPVHGCLEAYYLNERVSLAPFIELDDEESMKCLVMLDIGVGILPAWVAAREIERGTLKAIPLGPKPLRRRWEIFRRRGGHAGFGATLFIGVSRAVSKDLLPGGRRATRREPSVFGVPKAG